MVLATKPSIRSTEVVLSITTLLVVAILLAIPPTQLSQIDDNSPAGIAIAIAIWATPTLLSIVGLYHTSVGPRRLVSYVTGGLSAVTLGIVLLNVYSVLRTPGMFTYGGRGAFFGPFVALATASLLGLIVLVDTGLTIDS